jgi:hypothetical protein
VTATNRNLAANPRDPRDWYRTPAWAIEELVRAIPAFHPTLDPCAGDGAILEAVKGVYPDSEMQGVEQDSFLVSQAAKAGFSLLKGDGLSLSWKNETVLMNPPYREAETWVRKGIREADTVAVLLRLGFLSSIKRHPLFLNHPPALVLVLSKRPSFRDDGKTDACDYAWIVWSNHQIGWLGGEASVGWIRP